MKLGIDPGNSGALALLHSDNRLIETEDMPTMKLGKKDQINPAELSKIVCGYLTMADAHSDPLTAYVERVHAMPGQGVASTFNFGMGYGAIQGVLSALSVPMILVTPQRWKRHCGLIGKDKDYARTIAQQLYPQAPLGRKKDIGRADAILIARSGGGFE